MGGNLMQMLQQYGGEAGPARPRPMGGGNLGGAMGLVNGGQMPIAAQGGGGYGGGSESDGVFDSHGSAAGDAHWQCAGDQGVH